MIIPKGKKITILENGAEILPQGIELTLDTPLTVKLQSNFDYLIGNSSVSKLLVTAGSALRDVAGIGGTGAFKEMGYRQWTGTEPLRFSFSTTLNMKHSARTDVFEPATALMKLCLPEEARQGEGIGLIAPGPSILTAMGVRTDKARDYSFRCGVFYAPQVLIEAVEPTFSSEIDEDGYPTWCTLQIDVTSLFTATTDSIDKFGVTR